MSPLALMLLSLLMVTLNLNCHAAASQKSLGSEGEGGQTTPSSLEKTLELFYI